MLYVPSVATVSILPFILGPSVEILVLTTTAV